MYINDTKKGTDSIRHRWKQETSGSENLSLAHFHKYLLSTDRCQPDIVLRSGNTKAWIWLLRNSLEEEIGFVNTQFLYNMIGRMIKIYTVN